VNGQQVPSIHSEWSYVLKDLEPYGGTTNGYNKDGQFRDPFAKEGMTFSYYSTGEFWVVWSPGPDRRYDMDLHVLQEFHFNGTNAYDLLKKYVYSCINGDYSAGDILRYCQRESPSQSGTIGAQSGDAILICPFRHRVKVIDILGNDTTKTLRVEVK
jgi:hypothetical protein